jgi:uncharacterized membrane protein
VRAGDGTIGNVPAADEPGFGGRRGDADVVDDETLIPPSREDPVVRSLSTVIGGPPGPRARLGESRWWTPIRVLIFFAVIACTLSWVNKSLCVSHGYGHEYQYTRLCYSDVYALYYNEGLNTGKVPILDNVTPTPDANGVVHHKYVEYPVIIAGVMGAAEGLAHTVVGATAGEQRAIDAGSRPGANEADRAAASSARGHLEARQGKFFFNITAAFILICGVIVVVLTGLTAGRRRVWDAALVGLAPALVLHADVNWDLVAVAFTAGAMFAWSRRAPAVAGMLLGFGVATKFYPLLLLIPMFALCLRAGRMRAYFRMVMAAVVAWSVTSIPVWVANPAGFGQFYSFSRARGPEYNSLFYAFQYVAWGPGHGWDPGKPTPTWLNFWSGLLLVAALAAIVALILLAPTRPRLGQVAFLTVFAFLITNKVYSPQYVLWLLPLVALARPRWRYWLVWQATEIVLLITLYAHLIYADTSGNKGIPYPAFFFLGDLPRDIALLILSGLIIREAWCPELDIVRADGTDDPAGGVLDGAPDWPHSRPWRDPYARPEGGFADISLSPR